MQQETKAVIPLVHEELITGGAERDLSPDSRPVVNMDDLIKQNFESGKGVLYVNKDLPDAVLIAAIRRALQAGKSFTVIPEPANARSIGHIPVQITQNPDDLKKVQ